MSLHLETVKNKYDNIILLESESLMLQNQVFYSMQARQSFG